MGRRGKRSARESKYTQPTRRYEGPLRAVFVDPTTGLIMDPVEDAPRQGNPSVAPETESEKREAWGK